MYSLGLILHSGWLSVHSENYMAKDMLSADSLEFQNTEWCTESAVSAQYSSDQRV